MTQSSRSKANAWPAGDIRTALEYEDRAIFNEDSGQPTSIDLVVQGEPALFIEAKLVEGL